MCASSLLQRTKKTRDTKIKAYVHADLLQSQRWADVKSEFNFEELGEELEVDGMTKDGMGGGAHAFSSGGKNGDQHRYVYQTAPLAVERKERKEQGEGAEKGEDAAGGTGGEETGEPEKPRHNRGREDGRMRDIREGLYGIFESEGRHGRGREIYVHLMKEFGLESQIKPGRCPDLYFGVKGPGGLKRGALGPQASKGPKRACNGTGAGEG